MALVEVSAVLPFVAMAVAAPLDASRLAMLDGLHAEVQRIREVRFTLPAARSMTLDELHQHEIESLREWMGPAGWRDASLELVALDIAEPGFDFEAALLALLSMGVQGFYDPDEHELVIVERGSGLSFAQVAGHELSHAQQMTRFEAWPTRVPGLGNDDVVAAFDGLLEGEAMLVELAILDVEPRIVDLRAHLPGFWPHAAPLVQPGVPSAVTESVSFAYTFGAEFAQSLLRLRGWSAFDRAFARPPLSTEQVLHPSKYHGRRPDWPQRVPLDVADALPHHRLVAENTVGELGIVTMLRQWGRRDTAFAVASGWDGDRTQVFVHRGQTSLVWRLVWDSPDDAASFELAIRERWAREPGFAIERRGDQVVVMRGVPEDRREAVLGAAWRGRPRTVRRIGKLVDRRARRDWRRAQRRDQRREES